MLERPDSVQAPVEVIVMTQRWRWNHAIALGSLGFILGLVLPAGAQTSSLPANVITPSSQSAVISNQLRLAKQLGGKALAGLQATSSDDAIPIDPTVIQAARDTYVLIRAARHGMELSKEEQNLKHRPPDPVLDLTFKRVTQAWDLSRIPVDKYSWGIPRADYLSQSIPALSQAIRLLDQALVMMP
jgi:hypothetical protein